MEPTMVHCNRKIVPVRREKGPHIGLYCPVCASWLKWAPKNPKPIAGPTMTTGIDKTPYPDEECPF